MKVVCDQCASSYNVPNARLKKPINKATCKQCGSRLLIPRPKPGAGEEDRVVVRAVPPTAPVANQTLAPADDDDGDKTMPIVGRDHLEEHGDDVPLISGAPMGASDIAKIKRVARAARSKPAAAPAPAQPSKVVAPALGAGEGLLLAFLGAMAAGLGTLLLALDAIGLASSPALTIVGVFLGIGGSAWVLLVLLLGSFGRQSGRPVISGMLGLFVGGLAAVMVVLAQAGLSVSGAQIAQEDPAPEAELSLAQAPPAEEPTVEAQAEAPTPARASPSTPRTSGADAVASSPLLAAAREKKAASTSTTEPTPKAEPAPKVEPAPKAEPAPSPAPVDKSPASRPATSAPREEPKVAQPAVSDGPLVDPNALELILQSSPKVQTCFYTALTTAEIQQPVSVPISFSLAASGSASGLRISKVSAPVLERCLDRALGSLTFPANGAGTVRYTFAIR